MNFFQRLEQVNVPYCVNIPAREESVMPFHLLDKLLYMYSNFKH